MPKAITLRNIPPATSRRIERRARKDGISLNKAVLRLLEEGARHDPSEPRNAPKNDLRKYAATWSKEEADEFDAYLRESRRIDPADWE